MTTLEFLTQCPECGEKAIMSQIVDRPGDWTAYTCANAHYWAHPEGPAVVGQATKGADDDD